MTELSRLRTSYTLGSLDETAVDPDPIQQFRHWLDYAIAHAVPEPNAMTLATADAAGRPSARIVLIKEVDAHGFVFYTNYDSRKGQELAANPFASLLFHWIALERQVRIEGRVERVDATQSDAYYAERPLDSRLGAWASPQSREITRSALETAFEDTRQRFTHDPPRPPNWGGYRVRPDAIEFWQGRPSRLHDRLRYQREPDPDNSSGGGTGNHWRLMRLAP